MTHIVFIFLGGSSNGHSPVLNLSKSGADQSGSEAGHTGLEDDDEDDNVSDVDEEDDKDQGERTTTWLTYTAGSILNTDWKCYRGRTKYLTRKLNLR